MVGIIRNRFATLLDFFEKNRDSFWLIIWISGILTVWFWDLNFLNAPALRQVETAFLNMIIISILVILVSTLLGWIFTLYYIFAPQSLKLAGIFLINLIKSLPQIVGILIGYVLITVLIETDVIGTSPVKLFSMAFVISIFIFPEIFDLLMERIRHFQKTDFYQAMLVCGIRETHIINKEIILRSSITHVLNKLISVFGMTVFLQCSIDFIISVGLSTEVSSVNFPVTLGSLLAKIDSKQDILAIGYALTHWNHLDNLFFEHLQGITVAFLIVFTLLCIYHISNGYSRRHHL